MIFAAVVCPHPPLLLRELSGAEDAVPQLRDACHDALATALAAGPDLVVVVGGADEAREWDPSLPVDLRRFGTTGAPPAAGLPLSLGVAKRLLDESGWVGPVRFLSVSWAADDAAVADLARVVAKAEGRVLLLVLGDGSPRRGEKAPGHLDERSFAFDAEIGRALEEGDAEALARLDPVLAGELMVLGRPAFAVLGHVVSDQGGRPRPRVLYSDDPLGVQYTVALWDLSGS